MRMYNSLTKEKIERAKSFVLVYSDSYRKYIPKQPLELINQGDCFLEDVRSAVDLLKEKLHEYHKEPFDSIWDAVVNQYEQDIQKLIDDCFPVFKKMEQS